jgi:hypothetical protein
MAYTNLVVSVAVELLDHLPTPLLSVHPHEALPDLVGSVIMGNSRMFDLALATFTV